MQGIVTDEDQALMSSSDTRVSTPTTGFDIVNNMGAANKSKNSTTNTASKSSLSLSTTYNNTPMATLREIFPASDIDCVDTFDEVAMHVDMFDGMGVLFPARLDWDSDTRIF
jgi:hypothetical protein